LKRENKNINREENGVKQRVNITFVDFHLDLRPKYIHHIYLTFLKNKDLENDLKLSLVLIRVIIF